MCNICCNDEDISILKCPYCQFESCDECIMKFLVTTIDIKCMNCNKIWNKEFFYTNLPKNWINNEYKPYKKNILFEREKSLMPQTQPDVELEIIERKYKDKLSNLRKDLNIILDTYKVYIKTNRLPDILNYYDRENNIDTSILPDELEKYDKIHLNNYSIQDKGGYFWCLGFSIYNCSPESIYLRNIKTYYLKLYNLEKDLRVSKHNLGKKSSDEEYKKLDIEYHRKCKKITEKYLDEYQELPLELKKKFEKYSIDLHNFKVKISVNRTKYNEILTEYRKETFKVNKQKEEKVEKKEVVRPCPQENCRGFLKNWKCGWCETNVCKKCLIIKKNEHECKKEDIETAELLKGKDTKNCPSCGTYISKVTGCDQMWCPSCRCAFSWNTLKIETGIIHNPHFYEWKRNNGGLERNAGDDYNFCGQNYLPIWNIVAENRTIHNYIDRLYGFSQDIRTLRLPALPQPNTEIDNKDCRIKYMMKDYDQEMLKKLIYAREKKRDSDVDIRQILEMFTSVVQETLYSFYENRSNYIVTQKDVDTLQNLIIYVNDVFRRLEPIYDLKMPFINTYNGYFEYQTKKVEQKKEVVMTDLELEKKKIPELKELTKKIIKEKKIPIAYSKWKKDQYIEFLKKYL